LTVHKSQGSEWEKVFLCLHQSHAVMLQRELLYTAVTRAKKELVVICEDDTFVKGIESQRIKGNTLEEKAEFFKGKIANGDEQS
jgi:exodeoxyribonuclease V alpha subunit